MSLTAELIKKWACSGMFADALDSLGEAYTFLPLLGINPTPIYGPARCATVQAASGVDENVRAGLGFLSQMNPGDVLLVKGSKAFAYFGQLMGELGEAVGIGGAVILGYTRDSKALRSGHIGVYAEGTTPVDIKGRGFVSNFDESIEVGGGLIETGDRVYADSDGVLVFKSSLQKKVEALVLDAIGYESNLSSLIRSGKSVPSDSDTFMGF